MPISADVSLGKNVKIFQPELVNLYGCSIEAETRIGAFVEIQKNATVGARCKISSHSFICEGVTIEDEVFVGHGVMFTNDRYPRAVNEDGMLQTEADCAVVATRVNRRAAIGIDAMINADVRTERLRTLAARYPTIKIMSDCSEMFSDPSIDAIIIATPVSSHFELGMAALKADKHVLVEKPLAANSEQAGQLIEEAARRKRVL